MGLPERPIAGPQRGPVKGPRPSTSHRDCFSHAPSFWRVRDGHLFGAATRRQACAPVAGVKTKNRHGVAGVVLTPAPEGARHSSSFRPPHPASTLHCRTWQLPLRQRSQPKGRDRKGRAPGGLGSERRATTDASRKSAVCRRDAPKSKRRSAKNSDICPSNGRITVGVPIHGRSASISGRRSQGLGGLELRFDDWNGLRLAYAASASPQ